MSFLGGFFGDGSTSFFGSNPTTMFPPSVVPGVPSAPPPSSNGGGSSTADWLNTIFKFAQLGTQTYLAQDALSAPRPSTVTYGPNGLPVVTGGGASALVGTGGISSILGTSSIWLFLFVGILVLLMLKK